MSNLSFIEKQKLESLLEMKSGWVLDFTDRTFGDFFSETVKISIDQPKYQQRGTSKANRLRSFWEIEPNYIVGKLLQALLELYLYKNSNQSNDLFEECLKITERLLGIKREVKSNLTEKDFLGQNLKEICINQLPIEASIIPILENRLKEANNCLNSQSFLAVIFLCGSILEGVLLGVAQSNPKKFNQSPSCPKNKEGNPKNFGDWSLSELINVVYGLGMIKLDVKKFSDNLRDFRNYIHPYEQLASKFAPDHHTALICMQVLRAAIADLLGKR